MNTTIAQLDLRACVTEQLVGQLLNISTLTTKAVEAMEYDRAIDLTYAMIDLSYFMLTTEISPRTIREEGQ